MALKRFIAAGLVAMLLASAFAFAAGGGTSSDPVITLSYIQDKFIPQFNANANAAVNRADTQLRSIYNSAIGKVGGTDTSSVSISRAEVAAQIEYEAYMRLLDSGVWLTAGTPRKITLAAGERLLVAEGGEIQLISGSAVLAGEREKVVICATDGSAHHESLVMTAGKRFIITEGKALAGAQATGNAVLLVTGKYQVVPTVRPRHTDSALALYTLGVMRGTGDGFSLDHRATRIQALTMFLRLIGEEDEALAYTGTHPFTDVTGWGSPYVAYAYAKGYTKGVSDTKFGVNDEVTLEMYMTFLLRALGYSEASGDFSWDTAPADAVRLGVITDYERESAARRTFVRDTMSYLSWRVLEAKCKDGTVLSTKLIRAGAFTTQQYNAAKNGGVRRLG